MRTIEKSLLDAGLIKQQLNCEAYSDRNKCRATRKQNYFKIQNGSADNHQSQHSSSGYSTRQTMTQSSSSGC